MLIRTGGTGILALANPISWKLGYLPVRMLACEGAEYEHGAKAEIVESLKWSSSLGVVFRS